MPPETTTAPAEITPAAPSASAAPAATPALAPTPAIAAPPAAPASGDWFSRLPPEMQTDKALLPFKGKSETDLATSLSSAQKLVSSSIRLPGEKDTPEQRAAKLDDIANKTGRPATFDAYQITPPVLPENVTWDPAMAESFKPLAHGLRLTQDQVTGLVQWQAQQAVAQHQAQEAARATWQAELTKEWGPNYQTNKAMAIRGLTEYGGRVLGEADAKGLLDLLDQSGLGDHPALVKIFAAIGADHNEGSLVTGEGTVPTAESLETEIAKVQALPEFMDSKHPQHDAVMGKYLELFRRKTNSVMKAMG